MFVFVLAVALAVVSSFLCSVSEAVLLSVGHAQIQALGKSRAGRILRHFKREIDVPIAAILTLNTMAHTVGASLAGATYQEVFDKSTLWVFTAGFTLAILIFSEIIPKTLGVAFGGRLLVPVAYGVATLVTILRPVIAVTRGISRLVKGGSGHRPVTSLEEIRLLTALGRTEGVLASRTAELIEGAAVLRELRARDVMVPRAGMVYLSGTSSIEENLALVRGSGHSRFPFTSTGELDRVEGVVLVKDLLFHLRDNPGEPDWTKLCTKVVVVPAATPLERLLRIFQEERRHLALVVDEYGGTQGMVTLEDVLEEIVGDIEDETDRVDPAIVKRSDGSLVCRGWAEVRRVLEELDLDGSAPAVTVGGLAAQVGGRVPKVGDVLTWEAIELEVLLATPWRAERIVVRKRPSAAETSAPD